MMHKGFDINELFQEAKNRWLKPTEILFILENHEDHQITLETPQKPLSGSLFLFNRRVLRFFRKDGHTWRKKKDGRSGGEAHERLKVGNVEALSCYYAHGEQNPNFQRRSYWMLDKAYEHIVLVHYREVSEGRHITGLTSSLPRVSSSTFSQDATVNNAQNMGYTTAITGLYEPKLLARNNEISHVDATDRSVDSGSLQEPEANQALRRLTEQLGLDGDDSSLYSDELPPYCQGAGPQDSGSLPYERGQSNEDEFTDLLELKYRGHDQILDRYSGNVDDLNTIQSLQNSGDDEKHNGQPLGPEYTIERKQSPSWKEMLELCSTLIDSQENNLDTLTLKGVPENSGSRMHNFETGFPAKDMMSYESLMDYGGNNVENRSDFYQTFENNSSRQLPEASEFPLESNNPIISPISTPQLKEAEISIHSAYSSGTRTSGTGSNVGMLEKTNSFDWTEIKNIAIDNHVCSPDYNGMCFDQESLLGIPFGADAGLTVAQKQRFSIREISPEWAYPGEDTKVIIIGKFLCDPSECTWACMFGDTEVPLDIIQDGVLCCRAPQHPAGKVTLCITSNNRESCSELREFEYRINPNGGSLHCSLPKEDASKSTEELLLLLRFASMLLRGHDTLLGQKEENVESEIEASGKLKVADSYGPWGQIAEALSVGTESPSGALGWLLQEFLKDKLQQWLSSKYLGGEFTGCSLTKQDQGIIHMVSGLGYEWALTSILNSGIGVNIRDKNGWTALHWAACFGREKMVAILLAAGALPGAVTDPTPHDPIGKTPAFIAAHHGHKGLAGYLSEAALTSHLSSLTLEESEFSKGSAAIEAERTVESISERSAQISVDEIEDQLSLKDSLAAVRNAALAAARIQAAFHARSFRIRLLRAAASCNEYNITPGEIFEYSVALNFQRGVRRIRETKDKAALSIQKKFRGWKRRKEFLDLRQKVVKIQAHVRGYQIRKKYRELLWTVNVLEKAILRWRRKGAGLRGFRADSEPMDENDDDDGVLKVFIKQKVNAALDEAVRRVMSMVESTEARQQYRRMLKRYQQAKAALIRSMNETSASSSPGSCNNMDNDNDDDIFQFS